MTDDESLAKLDLKLHLGCAATSLEGTTARLADGNVVQGDAVVIATGLISRQIPGQPPGTYTLRTIDDARRLRSALSGARSMLVIGAGFIGLEVASAAVSLGLETTVIESLPTPLTHAPGQAGGEICARLAAESGVRLRCGTSLTRFVDEHTVVLDHGETVSADIILVGVGGAPQPSWLKGSGLETTNGIACDSVGRAIGGSSVWAVGDVAAYIPTGGYYR